MGANHRKEIVKQMDAMTQRMVEQSIKQSSSQAEQKPLLENEKRLMRVNINDIEPYDRNPRTEVNPEYESIKESIRAKGLETILTITKRPGDTKYTLAKGGKTRLQILKELALEDGEKWLYQECLIEPFHGETALLSSHLIENMQRGAMSFWDTAQGIMAMKATMEQERGRPIGKDELQTEFAQIGVSLDTAFPSEADFAVKHYSSLGNLAHAITRNDIRRSLRPQFNSLKDVWLKHPSFTEEMFELHYGEFVAIYQASTYEFNLPSLMDVIEGEYALILDLDIERLRAICALVSKKEYRDSPLETLIALTEPLSEGDGDQASSYANLGGSAEEIEPAQDHAPTEQTGLTPGQQRLHDKLSGKSSTVDDEAFEDEFEDVYSKGITTGYAGIPGLQVSDGSNLTPIKPAAPKLPPHKQLVQTIQGLLRQFNLQQLIIPTPPTLVLPLGMILDFPQEPLADPNAGHAWWLVASFTGQIDRTIDPANVPDCLFKELYLGTEGEDRMFALMGHVFRDDSSFIVSVATNPKHPFSDVLFEMLTLLRQHNQKKEG